MVRLIKFFLMLFLFNMSVCWAGITFDGDERIYDTTRPLTGYPFSVAAWFNISSSNTGTLWGHSESGSDSQYMQIRVADSVIQLIARNTSFIAATGTTIVDDGEWHIAIGIWRSATDREIYVDGISEATSSTSVTFPSPSSPWMQIGSYRRTSDAYEDPLTGSLTEVYVYTKSLSAAERALLGSGIRGVGLRISDCVTYWPLNDVVNGQSGEGETFTDRSGNSNDGTGDDGGNNQGLTSIGEFLSYPSQHK